MDLTYEGKAPTKNTVYSLVKTPPLINAPLLFATQNVTKMTKNHG